jgi:hypothetical protein
VWKNQKSNLTGFNDMVIWELMRHKDPNPSHCENVRTFLILFLFRENRCLYSRIAFFCYPVVKKFLAFTKREFSQTTNYYELFSSLRLYTQLYTLVIFTPPVLWCVPFFCIFFRYNKLPLLYYPASNVNVSMA